jgi:hypothetical protein
VRLAESSEFERTLRTESDTQLANQRFNSCKLSFRQDEKISKLLARLDFFPVCVVAIFSRESAFERVFENCQVARGRLAGTSVHAGGDNASIRPRLLHGRQSTAQRK